MRVEGRVEWESPAADVDADVLVIGGGAAGATAALAALEEGARVVVVRRSLGATALTSGAFELAPDPLASPRSPLGEGRSLQACVRELAALHPDHPYGVLAGELPSLAHAIELWERQVEGVEFASMEGANFVVATSLGTLKAAGGGLTSVLRGNLSGATEAVGVVGFTNHLAYDAALWARNLADASRRAGLLGAFVPVACDLLDDVEGPNLRPWEVAARIQADPAAFAQEVRRVAAGRVRQFLFPPVLEDGVADALRDALGAPCAEAAAVGQSVPGLRLQRALDRALALAGARLLFGTIERAPGWRPGAGDGPVELRLTGGRGRQVGVAATTVVLATGKYLAGGLMKNGCLFEPLLGLPIHTPAPRQRCRGSQPQTSSDWRDEQPIFRAGVRADRRMHPVDEGGAPVDPSLFVCGDIVAGHDPARDGAAMGTALLTGYVAGYRAAASARERGWGG